jgi:hypothetical protein
MKWSLIRIRSCQSFNLIPSFMKQYPISLIWLRHTNWGWNKGLEGQTRTQRQGDFMDSSINSSCES